MEYLALKWIHILSSTVLFGTGIGSAFYLLAIIFVALVPLVAWLLRDASMPLQAVVAGGSALEAGAVAHIYVERVRGRSPALGWSVHAVVAAVTAVALFAALAA